MPKKIAAKMPNVHGINMARGRNNSPENVVISRLAIKLEVEDTLTRCLALNLRHFAIVDWFAESLILHDPLLFFFRINHCAGMGCVINPED